MNSGLPPHPWASGINIHGRQAGSRGYSYFPNVFVFSSVSQQTISDTDQKFATHTPLNHIWKCVFFSKKWPCVPLASKICRVTWIFRIALDCLVFIFARRFSYIFSHRVSVGSNYRMLNKYTTKITHTHTHTHARTHTHMYLHKIMRITTHIKTQTHTCAYTYNYHYVFISIFSEDKILTGHCIRNSSF